MKRSIAFFLAAALLLTAFTGCSGDNDIENISDTRYLYKPYDKVLSSFYRYFPPYDDPTEDGLPMVKDTGAVSLKNSLESDERFRIMLMEFAAEPDFQKRCEITEKLLAALCEAEEISDEADPFSKRRLEILRKFYSSDQDDIEEKVPEPQKGDDINIRNQTTVYEMAYDSIVSHYCLSLICSLGQENLSYIGKYADSESNEYPYMDLFNQHLLNSYEQGVMSENEFSDSITAMTVYAFLNDENLRMPAEFYACVRERALYAAENSSEKRCLELAEKAFRNTNEVLSDPNSESAIVFEDGINEYLYGLGGGSNLLIGGSGGNVFEVGRSENFLFGGIGDDVYDFTRGGRNTIYDLGGLNLIDLGNSTDVYAVGFSEDEFKNDVKLCFGDDFVIIKDFLANPSVLFDVLVDGEKFACGSPENPLSDIHEPGYVPGAAAPPR